MTVIPNPAKDKVLVTVQLDDNTKAAQLRILNNMGQLIYTVPVYDKYSKIEVPLTDFSTGLYLCTTYQDGKVLFTSRLSVIK